MQERRKFPRQMRFASGSMVDPGLPDPTRCVVKDISPAGAHLLVNTVAGLPTEFKLDLPGEPSRACFVRWRDRVRLGVVFLPPQATPIER